jgi:hypothetical protein
MGKPKMPKGMSYDPIEMIEKNAEVNRISEVNPYGKSEYVTNPDGTQTLVKSFTGKNQDIFEAQQDRTLEGTYKNPLAALGDDEIGGGFKNLLTSMGGKVADRYMEGREDNIGKSGSSTTPPEIPVEPSTATQVRELQEKQKLAEQMAVAQTPVRPAQQAPRSPLPRGF